MSMAPKGLGRGIDALFNGAEGNNSNDVIHVLATNQLSPNPNQPRKYFDDNNLQELAQSIKTQGIIQPLLVRKTEQGYQIVAGERRWRAAQFAGLEEVPVIVRELNDQEAMAAALIENLQREDLNPLEEAMALNSLRETLNITQEDLASRLGKSRPAVANALRLLQLTQEAQNALRGNKISAGHARSLLGLDDPHAQNMLLARILNLNLTVRDCEDIVNTYKEKKVFPWQEESPVESTEDAIQPPSQESPRMPSRKKSPKIRKIQSILSKTLACKASISGDEQLGRISISYTKNEDFIAILQKLGIDPNID